jgi:hypothetical protein
MHNMSGSFGHTETEKCCSGVRGNSLEQAATKDLHECHVFTKMLLTNLNLRIYASDHCVKEVSVSYRCGLDLWADRF